DLDGEGGKDKLRWVDNLDFVHASGTSPDNPVDDFVQPIALAPPPPPNPGTSAQGTLSANQAVSIKAGLQQLMASVGSAGGELATGSDRAGTITADILGRGLEQPVVAYLDLALSKNEAPTLDGVVNAIKTVADASDLDISTTNVLAVKTGSTAAL